MLKFKMPSTFNGFLPPYPQRRMTDEEMKILFIMMNLGEQGFKDEFEARVADDPIYRIIKGRADNAGVQCEFRCIIFMTLICHSPGECVMAAWSLAKMNADLRGPLNLHYMLAAYFGDGIPDTEDGPCDQLWDSQKGFNQIDKQECDNLLDSAPWPTQLKEEDEQNAKEGEAHSPS